MRLNKTIQNWKSWDRAFVHIFWIKAITFGYSLVKTIAGILQN